MTTYVSTCNSLALFIIVMTVSLLVQTSGCDNSGAVQTTVADPKADLDWVMKRLDHVLQPGGQGGAQGIRVLDRDLQYELIPPRDEQTQHTAHVTVTTKTTFLPQPSTEPKQDKKPKDKTELPFEINDPLAPKPEDTAEILDLPGIGPQIDNAKPAAVEPKVLETISEFDLIYRDDRWQLTKQPELEHERYWFEYALN